jgi:outer membrane lipoprotein LolB
MLAACRRRWLVLALALGVTACAQPPRLPAAPDGVRTQWIGRLALRIDSDPVQSFHAAFDLRGDASAGELSLFSPLGSTLARMVWAPGQAQLRWNGQQRAFDSIAALTRAATGTELPIASLFEWLAGRDSRADGWSADLGALADGKLLAERRDPAPAVQLRLVIE